MLQVQVEDPDYDENGLITMALQMGMPRLDFYLNTSTGVLTSTSVLDREQIGLYYLRIIAYDAGKFPRTSTSTLTVKGEPLNMGDEPGWTKLCWKLSRFSLVRFEHCVIRMTLAQFWHSILIVSPWCLICPHIICSCPFTSCNLCVCVCAHQFWMLTMRHLPSTLLCTMSRWRRASLEITL